MSLCECSHDHDSGQKALSNKQASLLFEAPAPCQKRHNRLVLCALSSSQVVTLAVCYMYSQVDGTVTHGLAWKVAQSGELPSAVICQTAGKFRCGVRV